MKIWFSRAEWSGMSMFVYELWAAKWMFRFGRRKIDSSASKLHRSSRNLCSIYDFSFSDPFTSQSCFVAYKMSIQMLFWGFRRFRSSGCRLGMNVCFEKMTRTIYQPHRKKSGKWKTERSINQWWKFINLESDTITKRRKYLSSRCRKICHFRHFA